MSIQTSSPTVRRTCVQAQAHGAPPPRRCGPAAAPSISLEPRHRVARRHAGPSRERRQSTSSAVARPFVLDEIARPRPRSSPPPRSRAEILEPAGAADDAPRAGCRRRAPSGAAAPPAARDARAARRPGSAAKSASGMSPPGSAAPAVQAPRAEAHDRLQLLQRVLGELAVGRDLAAEDRQQRRPAVAGVEVEDIVAGDGRGVAAGVVVERPHAGIGPDDVGGRDLALEVAVDHPAQIVGLVRRDRGRRRVALVGHVGGADQAELALERDHEHDPLVVVLQDVGVLARIEPGHDDVRALDQPHPLGRVHAQRRRRGSSRPTGPRR